MAIPSNDFRWGNGPEAKGGTLTNTAQDIGAIREPGGVSEGDALDRLECPQYFLTTGQEATNDLILPNEWNGLLRRRAHRLHRHHQVLTTCRESTAIPAPATIPTGKAWRTLSPAPLHPVSTISSLKE